MRAKNPSGGVSVLSDQYVAGLFDGEGCICIQKVWVPGKYEKYCRTRMRIFITTTNLPVIKLLQKWFGKGNFSEKGSLKNGWKAAYDWRLNSKKDMIDFLNRIKDHVVIKREQVQLALQFCDTLRDKSGCGKPLTKTEHGLREVIYQRFWLLRRKR